ncbi:ribonuclease III [Legionella quinlivanii]|uniref:Ribonuclease 3 n=1 Tax=Legionella quinlivanii TaxID=45073 RepID=A0A0W0XLX0_9GAMM|nr:ribonuclease III [Legionella quinlivanii]KTD45346.1 ribonuclease III [Legionella quinlivanii]MCW8451399.1 ribonuclease III [Legionella quinlivanii]SEG15402.1 ribonuclease-3 [Legionella quinlivanii DSM 21216]STY10398.1 ribonuclease III [Legionella quinlivanii]
MVRIDLERLYRRLGYRFANPALLKQALTHCSVSNETNNERFEFLGDSILSFVIADALFEKFPQQSEGQLSRLRAYLVKGDMLAEIAVELELGDFLILGQGELKSGGFRRASILADALEAIIAAVYLDSGIDASKQLILKLFASRLDSSELQDNLKDSKTQLQEFLQASRQSLPEYNLLHIKGEEHEQLFYVSCVVKGYKIHTEGFGPSRRKAEQEAAKQFLALIKAEKT